jgi:hypothetical protein
MANSENTWSLARDLPSCQCGSNKLKGWQPVADLQIYDTKRRIGPEKRMEVTTTNLDRERHAHERFSGAFVPFIFAPVWACPRSVRTVRPPQEEEPARYGLLLAPAYRKEESPSRVGARFFRPQ